MRTRAQTTQTGAIHRPFTQPIIGQRSALPRCRTWLLSLLLLLPGLSLADVYRWIDANGVVNFTQQAPHGVRAELISANNSVRGNRARGRQRSANDTADSTLAAVADSETEDQGLLPEQQKILDDLKRAEADRQAALVEARASNCERARSVLTNLTKIGRVRVRADDGSQIVLAEEERQRRISAAQEAIAVNCAA